MLIKTLLNKAERFKSFVYTTTQVMFVDGEEALVIDIVPRRNSMSDASELGVSLFEISGWTCFQQENFIASRRMLISSAVSLSGL